MSFFTVYLTFICHTFYNVISNIKALNIITLYKSIIGSAPKYKIQIKSYKNSKLWINIICTSGLSPYITTGLFSMRTASKNISMAHTAIEQCHIWWLQNFKTTTNTNFLVRKKPLNNIQYHFLQLIFDQCPVCS